jgi:hypothetical protein
LFIVGELLVGLTEIMNRLAVAILLVHHTKKGVVNPFAPPELEDIAWSGFQEWVRQWILIGRREPYDPDHGGSHKLWLNVGGSAGHSGLWGVDIEEGVRQDPGGRRWDVSVVKASEARTAAQEQADERKAEVKAQQREKTLQTSRERILDALRRRPEGETRTELKDMTGMNSREFSPAVEALLESSEVEECEITKGKRTWTALRVTRDTRDKPGQNRTCPG